MLLLRHFHGILMSLRLVTAYVALPGMELRLYTARAQR